MKKLNIMLAVIGMVAGTMAGTYTWKGATSGNAAWNSADNWTPASGTPAGVPNAGDTAMFTGEMNVSLTDNIALNDGTLTIQTSISGKTLVHLTGVISGSGGICKKGDGNVYLDNTANTYSGQTTIAGPWNSQLYAANIGNIGVPSSLGQPTGANAALNFPDGNGAKLVINTASTFNTDRPFNGKYPYVCIVSGGTLNCNGEVSGTNVGSRNSGTVNIYNAFTGNVYRTDGGTLNIRNTANKISTVSSAQGTINLYSFGDAASGTISLGQSSSGSTGTVAWKGAGDCTLPHTIGVSWNGTLANSSAGTTFRVTGAISASYIPAQFNVRGSGSIILDGALPDRIKLFTLDSVKLTLNGANVATNATSLQGTTALYVNNSWTATDRPTATMTVDSSATLAGTGTVNVASVTVNGTLGAGSIETTGTFTVSCPLTLATGSKLKLRIGRSVQDRIAAQAVTVLGTVTVNVEAFGDNIRNGAYRLLDWSSVTGSTANFKLGSGAPEGSLLASDADGLYLSVPASGDTYTWQGDDTANAWDTSSLNWLLGSDVAAYVAGAGAHFDDTGSASPAVNLSSRIAPASVVVDASSKNYTFFGTGGLTGAMSLVKRGTATLTMETANDYTGLTQINAGKLVLNGSLDGSQVVVANGANIEQGAGGAIAGATSVTVGDGTNIFHGVNTFTGRVEQNATGGRLALMCVNNAQSFGAASEVWIRGNLNSNTGILFDDNASISGKTLIIANASGHRPGISSSNNVSGGWLGDIVGEAGSGNGDNLYLTSSMGTADPGGVLTIGVAGGNNVISGKIASVNLRGWRGTIKLYSRLNVTCGIVRNDQGSVYFYSTNNVHGGITLYEGTVSVRATNAICTTAGVSMGKNQNGSFATFELYGCDQTLAGISDSYTANTAYSNVRTISTPAGKPAVLTFNPASGKSYQFGYVGTTSTTTAMTGPLSIVKTGDGTQTFGGTYAVTGSIEVRGGTLALAAANVFERASMHVVSGGTLACTAAGALGGNVDLAIGAMDGSAGVVRLDADQAANQLFIGGAQRPAGTYGSPTSSAKYRLACFTGTGLLAVKHGGGTVLIFR